MNKNDFQIAFDKLMANLQLKYHNLDYYYEAFIHPSYANEHGYDYNYERLEFLGDAILDFLVSEYLFSNYRLSEGEMSKIRASYVCEQANASYTADMHLIDLFLVGKGALKQKENEKISVLGNLFESFLGAIYLDKGLDDVRKILERYLFIHINLEKENYFIDYKSKLQEYVQSDSRKNVSYEVVEEKGLAHDKTFIVIVKHDGVKLGTGIGKSKKEAEQNAAKEALSKLATK